MLPFQQAKNTAFAMETLDPEQELRPPEAAPEPRMLPPQQAQKHRICIGEPER